MPKNEALSVFEGFRRSPAGSFAFTMVPNQFLDEIVPLEKPCVVKVICLILRRTLGWVDERGQRRQQEQVAYSEFAREMNMSMQAVADGLKIALEKGYIIRTRPGTLRGEHSGVPEGAWYSLRWASPAPVTPLTPATTSEPTSNTGDVAPYRPHPALAKKQSGEPAKIQSSLTPDSRVMNNKADSVKKALELNRNSSFKPARPGKYSAYIGNVITEITGQLGDNPACRLANIKRALNLWDKQQLDEQSFVRLLYQARDLTRSRTHPASPEARPSYPVSWVTLAGISSPTAPLTAPAAARPGRMAYFFRVVEDLCGKTTSTPPAKPLPQPAPALAVPNPTPADWTAAPVPAPGPATTTLPQFSDAPVAALGRPDPTPDYSARRLQWAGLLSLDPEQVAARWQQVLAACTEPDLAALAARSLGIEASLARPDLLAAVGLTSPVVTAASGQLDIIIICRNAFDARNYTSYLAGLQAIAGQVWARPVFFHLTYA